MDNRDGAFVARPEHEMCQAGFTGCSGERSIRIHCVVEGADMTVCLNCSGKWRMLAINPEYKDRCPRCSRHPRPPAPIRQPPPLPGPLLSGPVADAIDKAMHQEGLNIDVRERVLRRLHHDASVLESEDVSDSIQYALPVTPMSVDEFREFTRKHNIKWAAEKI